MSFSSAPEPTSEPRSQPAARADQIRNRVWLQGQYRSSANLSARATLHIRFRTNLYSWQRWVFDHIRAPHSARILELGCGPGPLWIENYDRIPVGWRVWLTDLSPGMAEEAAQGLHTHIADDGDRRLTFGQDYAASVTDAQVLPFTDGAFDVVVANHMLYHLGDVDACLGEVQRVLRKGGRFYAATNGRGHMRELHEFVRDFEPNLTLEHWGRNVFDLEQGLTKLPRYFSHVQLHSHPNALHVTEPAPLAAYVLSGILDDSDPEYVARFRRYVIDHLATAGPLHITAQTGLFEAVKL
ncbi:MAG: class I SAM-dependent methyltransferase [Litorilinea sp.]